MKAVYYHADSHFAWGDRPGAVYKKLALKFKEQCNGHKLKVIHLTCDGHEGWGDENHSYPLNPRDIVYNREEAFSAFLEKAPDDWYWFTEPDTVIHRMFGEPKNCDLVMLYRGGDDVPLNPSFRIARPSALPVFHAAREEMRKETRRDWHGDSAAWTAVWNQLGKPKLGVIEKLGVKIELRPFADYVKPGRFTRNLMGRRKTAGL